MRVADKLLKSFTVGKYDILLIDIYTDGTSNADGIEAAKEIRSLDSNVLIAFTTTSIEHTLDSYRLGAIKYIEKPVSPESVKEIMGLALVKKKNRPMITITAEGGDDENIPLDEIMYLEQFNHRTVIYLTDRIFNTSRTVKISDLEAQLPFPPFLRCYQSYIVNFNHVHKLDQSYNAFIMKNGGRAYIRRGSYTKCKDLLNQWNIQNLGK